MNDNTAIVDALVNFGNDVVERAQRNLGATRMVKGKKRRAVATGTLKNSLTFSLRRNKDSYTIKFIAKGAAANYADYVEEGRKPNSKQPPLEPILKWINDKKIKVRDEKGKIVKQTESRKKGLAFSIARGIGKNGIPAVKYYENAYNDALPEHEEKIVNALQAYIESKLKQ
jgi:hypothetical protein